MRFACDTGGTFTDLIVEEADGQLSMYKSATTPQDPVRGVLDTLELAAKDRGLSLSQLLGRGDIELRVPGEDWDTRFHVLHEKRYGYQRPATPVEAVTLRSIASAPGPPLEMERIPRTVAAPTVGRTRAYTEGDWTEVDRVWRSDLGPDQTLDGPALVLEYSSTTWVPRGWGLTVDEWGNLHLSAT